MREVAVTGVGTTPMREGHGKPFWDVAHDAARDALADAGLSKGDLDSVVLAGLDLECGRTISNMYAAPAAGGYMKDEIRVADDGLLALALAWMRVASGLFDTTMVLAYGQSSETHPERLANLVFDPVLERDLGMGRLLPLALSAGAYEAATPRAREAADALAARRRAAAKAAGPEALPARPVVAGWAAPPILRAHVAPLCDGAAAVILQAGEVARRGRQVPVELRAVGWACESGELGRRDLARSDAAERAARMAYERAGAGPADVAFAEVHSPTPWQEMIALEALGLALRGRAPEAVLADRLGPSGTTRVNVTGGSFAGEASVASGMYRFARCVRAIRAGDAPLALAHSASGPAGQQACVALAGRWTR